MMMPAFLDIGSLFESQWTGIPTVVAAVAGQAILDESIEWRFMYEEVEIPRETVSSMLAARTGAAAREQFTAAIWDQTLVPYELARRSKAVFTYLKPMRKRFAEESMIVYDLSPLLTPQFHSRETVDHFGNRIRRDVETSSHFFPISAATRGDLEAYFGVARSRSTVVPLGVDVDPFSLSLAQELARTYQIEPYVAVLGTLEPRKNGGLVLEYLARNPAFARRFKIVFIGRDGWLDERESLMARAEAAGVSRDQVVFTGFVAEREKTALLYNAAFCIYASFFEGFGLPILEAATLGKMVVCSNTSSMPEVAPDRCFFFDPSDMTSFARAINLAERCTVQIRTGTDLLGIAAKLSDHGWEPCYRAIRDWVVQT